MMYSRVIGLSCLTTDGLSLLRPHSFAWQQLDPGRMPFDQHAYQAWLDSDYAVSRDPSRDGNNGTGTLPRDMAQAHGQTLRDLMLQVCLRGNVCAVAG